MLERESKRSCNANVNECRFGCALHASEATVRAKDTGCLAEIEMLWLCWLELKVMCPADTSVSPPAPLRLDTLVTMTMLNI